MHPQLPMRADWHVTAFETPRNDAGASVVESIRELRARILFDGGRRPSFCSGEGSYTDAQDLDFGAWHFVGRSDPEGPPLGYVRLSTPASAELFQSRAFLGAEGYRLTLEAEGLDDGDMFEHSRLVVEHRARKLGLGVFLNAMAIAAAQALGARSMIGISGTADGQDLFHERFGFRPVAGTRRYVDQYTEDVVVMLYRTGEGAGEHAALVARLRDEFPKLAFTGTMPTLSQPAGGSHSRPAGLDDGAPDRHTVWQPVLYRLADVEDRHGLERLLDSGQVRDVYDTIDAQLEELVRSRDPSRSFDAQALAAAKRQQLAEKSEWEYGTWVFYPWSGRLVHVLPRDEYRMVRTDRNRGKIERPDQRRLLKRRIGIIGLSVGNSAALTFVSEGIGGAFKLADFDQLGLSNLNRLRVGAHHLGVNKAVIAAREMFEIDPYLDIEIYPEGLTDERMNEFFTGGNGPIDLLVEECDTPYVKIAAREKARELGVPVVMDANDRGLLDVERFDLEPDRPLLHGRLGATTSAELRDLSFEEKVAVIVKMVDGERISRQLAAAIPRIGKTLSSWPQLASGVALGGALTAEAARRILLGSPCESGRFYVDLEVLISPERNTAQ